MLPLSKIAYTEREKQYRADPAICDACPLKAQCTTSDQGRQIKRSFDEDYVERVRSYHQTEAYKKAIRKRSVWVEPLFAEGKDWHGMRRFRLRRLWKVNLEALMRAAGQNLKRLPKKRGVSRHPWPEGAENALLFGILQRFFPQRKRQRLFVQLFLRHPSLSGKTQLGVFQQAGTEPELLCYS